MPKKHDIEVASIWKRHTRYLKRNHTFGIGLPTTVKEVLVMDAKNGNTFWANAIQKEMENSYHMSQVCAMPYEIRHQNGRLQTEELSCYKRLHDQGTRNNHLCTAVSRELVGIGLMITIIMKWSHLLQKRCIRDNVITSNILFDYIWVTKVSITWLQISLFRYWWCQLWVNWQLEKILKYMSVMMMMPWANSWICYETVENDVVTQLKTQDWI